MRHNRRFDHSESDGLAESARPRTVPIEASSPSKGTLVLAESSSHLADAVGSKMGDNTSRRF
jgi:hypothetical protein